MNAETPPPSAARRRPKRDLEQWIDHELKFYVHGMINDGDYAILRNNLVGIAVAHAANVRPTKSRKS